MFTLRSSPSSAKQSRSSDIICRLTALTGGWSSRTTATAPSWCTVMVATGQTPFGIDWLSPSRRCLTR